MDAMPSTAATSTPPSPRLPGRVALLGAILAGTAALPIAPDGSSFIDYVRMAFGRGALEGLLMVAGFGSPFLFGLAVAAASRMTPQAGARLVRAPIAMMHSQLLLVAWAVWRHGEAIAAGPMFLFAIVSAIYLALSSAKRRAEDTGPSLQWSVRWGAMVVASICMWARIQMFGAVKLGVAIDAAWLCAAGIVLLMTPRR